MKAITSSYTRWKLGLGLILIIFAAQLLVLLPKSSAAPLTSTYLRLSRLSTGSGAAIRLVFTTPTGGATSVSMAFGASWNSSLAASPTPSVATCPAETGAEALPGSLTASGSGGTLTINSVTALTAAHTYCVDIPGAVTANPSAGTYSVTVTAGSDSTTVVEDIVGSNADQVTVSASVSPSFSFSLQSNSTSFASPLSASGPSATSALNATVSTNAAQGWQMWAADLGGANAGLHSTTANKTIGYSPGVGNNAAALSTGVEGYNVGNNAVSGTTCGTPTYGKFYNGNNGTSHIGGGLDGTMRNVVSVTGAADTCNVPFVFNGSISNTTPAATDYTSTMTVVAAGNF